MQHHVMKPRKFYQEHGSCNSDDSADSQDDVVPYSTFKVKANARAMLNTASPQPERCGVFGQLYDKRCLVLVHEIMRTLR